jgi:hypothetical protein
MEDLSFISSTYLNVSMELTSITEDAGDDVSWGSIHPIT